MKHKNTYDVGTSQFRTIRNLKGFSDKEKGFVVNPEFQVEQPDECCDINVMMARYQKGQLSSLPNARLGRYDVPASGVDNAAIAFENQSPIETDGFDLADTGPLMAGVAERQAQRVLDEKAQKGSEKPSTEASPVVPIPPQGAAEKPPVVPSVSPTNVKK